MNDQSYFVAITLEDAVYRSRIANVGVVVRILRRKPRF